MRFAQWRILQLVHSNQVSVVILNEVKNTVERDPIPGQRSSFLAHMVLLERILHFVHNDNSQRVRLLLTFPCKMHNSG